MISNAIGKLVPPNFYISKCWNFEKATTQGEDDFKMKKRIRRVNTSKPEILHTKKKSKLGAIKAKNFRIANYKSKKIRDLNSNIGQRKRSKWNWWSKKKISKKSKKSWKLNWSKSLLKQRDEDGQD